MTNDLDDIRLFTLRVYHRTIALANSRKSIQLYKNEIERLEERVDSLLAEREEIKLGLISKMASRSIGAVEVSGVQATFADGKLTVEEIGKPYEDS